MACRTGCPTQDHESYGACLKSVNLYAHVGEAYEARQAGDNELRDYRAARVQGIQPATTRKRDIDRAVALSQAVDSPFNATDGSFGD